MKKTPTALLPLLIWFLIIAILVCSWLFRHRNNDDAYLIDVTTYFNNPRGRTGQMYPDAVKRKDGSYFIKYDSILSANSGIDSVIINIVKTNETQEREIVK